MIFEEINFLARHSFTSIADVTKYKENLENKLPELKGKRELLWRKHKSADISKKVEIFKEINVLTEEIDKIQVQKNACNRIINKYEESVKALDNIRKGTEEWDEAVQKLNSDVLELLKSYSGLSQYVSENEDGVLSISNEGLDWLEEQQRQAVNKAEVASYNAAIAANPRTISKINSLLSAKQNCNAIRP